MIRGVALYRQDDYLGSMSRLRPPFLSDRHFFLTVNLLRSRSKLEERDFQRLVFGVARMREKHGCGLKIDRARLSQDQRARI